MDRFNFKISQNVTHTESEEGASLRKKQGRLQEVFTKTMVSTKLAKISALPHTLLCIEILDK